MAVRIGNGTRGLLDREREVAAIEELLAMVGDVSGAVVLHGSAGLGKSALVAHAVAHADELCVLATHGALLERDYPWGAATSLFGPALAALAPGRRAAALSGAAGHAAATIGLDGSLPTAAPPALATVHGLFQLTCALAEPAGALLVIDDLQWLDTMTLRFLAYLLERLDELPIAVLLAVRPEPGAAAQVDDVLAHPRVDVLELEGLSHAAVGELVRQAIPDASDETCERCLELTAGNPFYLQELCLTLEHEGGSLMPPRRIARAVRIRLERLGDDAQGLARALAMLGDGATLQRACHLAGLSITAGMVAADALSEADILAHGEPLRYVHGIVQAAVRDAIPPAELADGHLRAARLLSDAGASPAAVGIHLLQAPRRGDTWVTRQLLAAADRAALSAGPSESAPFLERALVEPAPADQQPRLQMALAHAYADAGDERSVPTFAAALSGLGDPAEQARACEQQGRLLFNSGRAREASAMFELGLADVAAGDVELTRRLQAGFVAVTSWDGTTRERAVEMLATVPDAGDQTYGDRAVLAQVALDRAISGAPRQSVTAAADRAWADGALLAEDTIDGMHWPLVNLALYHADELDRLSRNAQLAINEAQRQGALRGFATASWCRAGASFERGAIGAALADLQTVLDARQFGWMRYLTAVHALYARCLLERGDWAGAARAVEHIVETGGQQSAEYPFVLTMQARATLASGDAQAALQQFLTAGRLIDDVFRIPALLPWRSMAAMAHRALGDQAQALALIDDELAFATQAGSARAIARALRARGQVLGGEEGVAAHRQAIDVLDGVGPRLQRIHGLISLGAALRRLGRRVEARELLREALALALAGGAVAAARRARDELSASGARLRRTAEARDELTPSERRVCDLAAAGSTNREIAASLFIGLKTVETHLHRSYIKLGITRRRQLADALGLS